MPPAVDWDGFFLPATLTMLRGGNPFEVYGYFSPPWLLVGLVPFAVMPYDLGRMLMLACSVVSLALVARFMGASILATIAVILSPLAFTSIAWGNVEWIALLGLLFPPSLGIVFLSVKPQMTFCVIIFLLIETWRERGAKQVLFAIAPTAILFAFSIALYGLYPLKWFEYQAGFNLSFYPYTLPVGICLMIQTIRTRKIGYALAASPLFFATFSMQAWMVILIAISSSTIEVCAASISTWGVVAMVRNGIGV